MSVSAVLGLQDGSAHGGHVRQQRVRRPRTAHLLESTPLGSKASEKRQTMERAQPITKADDSALREGETHKGGSAHEQARDMQACDGGSVVEGGMAR